MKKLLLFLMLIFTVQVFSQEPTSSIKGIVQDKNGAVIFDAIVSIEQITERKETQLKRITTTNNNGEFLFFGIPFGWYNIEVKTPYSEIIFKKQVKITTEKTSLVEIVLMQEKFQARMFDFYTEKNGENLKLLDEKITRFLDKLKQDSSIKGYVFINDKVPRRFVSCNLSEVLAPSEKQIEVTKKLNLPKERVPKSCFRFDFEIEFWIAKDGEKLPNNNRSCADFHKPCCCPDVKIISDEKVYSRNKTLIFKIDMKLFEGFDSTTFTWSITEGEIISGQGKNQIEVDISNTKSDNIIVSVEAKGNAFCSEFCQRIADFKVTIDKSK
ncbi:MAG: carboxypeptidase-like regulatory domain-containing protein [Pyrinomonadaceae bacterium]|nr:carboxypeptidase-like regulatory domain-containing protein [Pyrinomonadaceae bacterium]